MLRQSRDDMKITELYFLLRFSLIIIFLNFTLSLQQPKIKASDWLTVEIICLYKSAKWQLLTNVSKQRKHKSYQGLDCRTKSVQPKPTGSIFLLLVTAYTFRLISLPTIQHNNYLDIKLIFFWTIIMVLRTISEIRDISKHAYCKKWYSSKCQFIVFWGSISNETSNVKFSALSEEPIL